MRSKVNINGHPIHPILIPFPIAFLTGAFVFDLIGFITNNTSFSHTGAYLSIAGVCTGVIAAIPGIIDYFYIVPPNSSAKKRATKHMLVNLTAVILFAIAFIIRGGINNHPDGLTLVLQLTGLGFMTAGGYMGGTMVYRNQIGVDHRYANAGKWNEITINSPANEHIIGNETLLALNQMLLIHLNKKRIVLAHTEKGFTAFEDHCTHRGGSLADGTLVCETVECPWHGSQFDVNTGVVQSGPAKEAIKTYPVKLENGKIILTGK